MDPRPLTAEAVRSYLEEAGKQNDTTRFCVVTATPTDGRPLEEKFDLLMLHVSPSADVGAEIGRRLGALSVTLRNLPTVIYSDAYGGSEIAAAIRCGARGYLPSTLDCASIVHALRLLAAGLSVFPHAALPLVSRGGGDSDPAQATEACPSPTGFTTREWEVMQALHEGKPNKTIAREMGLSQSTVKVHVRNLFQKLGVHNRTEAALVAGQHLICGIQPNMASSASR